MFIILLQFYSTFDIRYNVLFPLLVYQCVEGANKNKIEKLNIIVKLLVRI